VMPGRCSWSSWDEPEAHPISSNFAAVPACRGQASSDFPASWGAGFVDGRFFSSTLTRISSKRSGLSRRNCLAFSRP